MSSDLHDYLEFNRIRWNVLEHLPTGDSCEVLDGADLGLSFGFGRIFLAEHFNRFRFGIWNIHPGELPRYRGRHPITHAFLNGDRTITTTVHQINEEIDQGNFIASGIVHREYRDTEQQIISKCLDLLDSSLLDTSINHFFNSDLRPVERGSYLQNYNKGVEFKNAALVTRDVIYNAALSQEIHGGVVINGKRYRYVHFYSDYCAYPANSTVIQCQDGFVVAY